MKKTPFTDVHIALGAKMHEFAGYNMPIEYTGIMEEHMTVVDGVGVFDVSHMGEFWVKGPKALEFVQKIGSNNAAALKVGDIQYTTLVNENGGVVDDYLLYRYEEEKFLMVVNAANIDKDWAWCQKQNTMGAELENASDHMAQLAIQGPKAVAVLQKLTDVNLSDIVYYNFRVGTFAGVENVIISHTGYTGAGGFELYFYPEYGQKIWDAIFEAGKEEGIKPIGLCARDTLRLEAGFCLYGNELDDEHTPLQAGLGWITKLVDNKPLVGREVLEQEKANGVPRKLVGFKLVDKGIARHGYEIVNDKDEVIGNVTSGSMSPYLKVAIGMGYVKPEYSKAGSEIFIKVRNKNLKAEVVKLPFREKK